jgi:hypothetical protein
LAGVSVGGWALAKRYATRAGARQALVKLSGR